MSQIDPLTAELRLASETVASHVETAWSLGYTTEARIIERERRMLDGDDHLSIHQRFGPQCLYHVSLGSDIGYNLSVNSDASADSAQERVMVYENDSVLAVKDPRERLRVLQAAGEYLAQLVDFNQYFKGLQEQRRMARREHLEAVARFIKRLQL